MRFTRCFATLLVTPFAREGLAQVPSPTAAIGRYVAKFLEVAGEPDLERSPTTARTTYRAVWLRSFDDAIAVRIVADGDRYSIITTQAPLRGDAFGPVRRDSTALPARAWSELQLRTAMKELSSTVAPRAIGLDGAYWILEARTPTRYHAVNWWSPTRADGVEGGYRRLFLELLSLGNVCVKPDAVY